MGKPAITGHSVCQKTKWLRPLASVIVAATKAFPALAGRR